MKILAELFIIFLKIGTFTIGSGYAMIPLIEKEVVEKKMWIDKDEFIGLLALAQSAPGPIAVDAAAFVGYKMAGVPGSIVSVLGTIFTAFTIMILFADYYTGLSSNPIVQRIFMGIRPAVVALVAAPVLRMGKSSNINKKNIIIPIATALLIVFFKVNPIILILIACAAGLLIGFMKESRCVK